MHVIRTDNQRFNLLVNSLGLGEYSLLDDFPFAHVQFDSGGFLPSSVSFQNSVVTGKGFAVGNISSLITGQPSSIRCPRQHVSYSLGHDEDDIR